MTRVVDRVRPWAAEGGAGAPAQSRDDSATWRTVGALSTWLLGGIVADLVLARTLTRLAIFVPKGDPWASIGALLGRAGAAADAMVLLAALLVLAALCRHAGARRSPTELIDVGAIAVVAAEGIALVLAAPVVPIRTAVDVAVVGVAVGAMLRASTGAATGRLSRAGIAVLASAVALAAVFRATDILAIGVAGELLFLLGAVLAGASGLRLTRMDRLGIASLVAGMLTTAVSIVFSLQAPLMWGSLVAWSTGLSAGPPAVAVGIALGIAVAGLPGLVRERGTLGVSAAIIVCAGYGLAASGLLLAGLLGLATAGRALSSEQAPGSVGVRPPGGGAGLG